MSVMQALQHRGNSDSEEELALGLRTYFDKALQVVLLYRGERQQAVQVRGRATWGTWLLLCCTSGSQCWLAQLRRCQTGEQQPSCFAACPQHLFSMLCSVPAAVLQHTGFVA